MAVATGTLKRELDLYQDTQARQGRPMLGRAALHIVYQKFQLSAAVTRSIDLRTLMELRYGGDLEGFMRAWDSTIVAMSESPPVDFLLALLEPQLRVCKQMDPLFIILNGNDPLPADDQFKFMYRAAWRLVGNKQKDGIRKALMQTPNLAVAAAALSFSFSQKLQAAQAQLAAAGLSVPGRSRRRRPKSPREPPTNAAGNASTAMAGLPTTPPPPVPGSCHVFWRTGECKFGERCNYKHFDNNGNEHPKSKVTGQAKAQAKRKARSGSPRRSPREDLRTPQQKRAVPCKFFNTQEGCQKGDRWEFGH